MCGGGGVVGVPESISFWILWTDLSLTKVTSECIRSLLCFAAGVFLSSQRHSTKRKCLQFKDLDIADQIIMEKILVDLLQNDFFLISDCWFI